MTEDEEAAALKAVCARRGLHVPQNDADSMAWKALAMDLAKDEPELQERGKPGRPPSMSTFEVFCYFLLISDAVALGKKERPVCKFICEQSRYKHRLDITWETLRKKVSDFRSNQHRLIKDPNFRTELLEGAADAIELLADYVEHKKPKAEETDKIVRSARYLIEGVEQYLAGVKDLTVDKILGEN
jgi:hypothetical protein